jgi:hypothetical protein
MPATEVLGGSSTNHTLLSSDLTPSTSLSSFLEGYRKRGFAVTRGDSLGIRQQVSTSIPMGVRALWARGGNSDVGTLLIHLDFPQREYPDA